MIYILPFLAVMVSFGVMALFPASRPGTFRLLLAFSGGFLLSLTVIELLPQVYRAETYKEAGLFILLGIVLQILLEFLSKGAEHGHLHLTANTSFPLALFLSLSIHAFLEGFPIQNDTHIIYGIVIHKIPIALLLSIFLLNAPVRRWKAFLFILLFALMTPLGTYAIHALDFIQQCAPYLQALVIGMFLHIATVILFESSEGHTFHFRKILAIILGIGLGFLL